MRRGALAAVLILACATCVLPARAEKLITSLSSSRVLITSSYAGAELVLFGVIERDGATVARSGGYDIVITARGPRGPLVVRQKRQAWPIWLNLDQRRYIDIPAFLAVLSTRALKDITGPEMAERLRIGIDHIIKEPDALTRDFDREAAGYRQALIRLKQERALFSADERAVTFLSPNIFRAVIKLPAVAPLGTYEIESRLFVGGTPLAQSDNQLEVSKIGFEAIVAATARDYPWLYGLVICFLSLFSGYLAHVLFRRN